MTLKIEDFQDIIYDHMADQPYEIVCEGCGCELDVIERDIDKDYDVKITVSQCETCTSNTIKETEENLKGGI